MKYLLILPLCILAVSKVTVQSDFSKKQVRKPVDALFFNALIFLSVAVISIPVLLRGISRPTAAYGAAFGFFGVMFQLFYCFALRSGPVSVTVLLINCSMIVPVCVSALFFHEPLTVFRILGIIVILITFVLHADVTIRRERSKIWIISTVLAFAANCGCSIVQKIFTACAPSGDNAEFVADTYLIAAVLSFVLLVFFSVRKEKVSYPVTPKVCLTALAIGGILFAFQLLNTYAVSVIDGLILFPVYNGGTTVLSTLAGWFVFHEKISRRQLLGIVSGIIGIIFLCL